MNTKTDLVSEQAKACVDVEVAQEEYDILLEAIQALHIWELRIMEITKAKASKCTKVWVAEKYFHNATKIAGIWKARIKELTNISVGEKILKDKNTDVELPFTTGGKVRELRMALGLTLAKFADILKVPQGTLGSWESREELSKNAKKIFAEFAQQHKILLQTTLDSWAELQHQKVREWGE